MRDLESRLSGLQGNLPGVDAQMLMAPRPRTGWRPGHVPEDCRDGAALLLVYPHDGGPTLVLTLRDPALPQHAGQVSLPGGAVESDESITDAALREAHEEIGVDAGELRILGRLSTLHIPVSGFALHPVVAVAERRPDLRPDTREVARVLEVGLAELASPKRVGVETRTFRGREFKVPCFHVHGERVWGATAMVLAEFLAVLDCAPDVWGSQPR